jgi:hypothetical protein
VGARGQSGDLVSTNSTRLRNEATALLNRPEFFKDQLKELIDTANKPQIAQIAKMFP